MGKGLWLLSSLLFLSLELLVLYFYDDILAGLLLLSDFHSSFPKVFFFRIGTGFITLFVDTLLPFGKKCSIWLITVCVGHQALGKHILKAPEIRVQDAGHMRGFVKYQQGQRPALGSAAPSLSNPDIEPKKHLLLANRLDLSNFGPYSPAP